MLGAQCGLSARLTAMSTCGALTGPQDRQPGSLYPGAIQTNFPATEREADSCSHTGVALRPTEAWFQVPRSFALCKGACCSRVSSPRRSDHVDSLFPELCGDPETSREAWKSSTVASLSFPVSKPATVETALVAGNKNPSSGRDASIPCPVSGLSGRPPFRRRSRPSQALQLPSFQHIGPAQYQVCSEASGPKGHGPGILSCPPTCRGKIVLDPSQPLLQGPLLPHPPRAARAVRGRTASPAPRALFSQRPTTISCPQEDPSREQRAGEALLSPALALEPAA
ncbi:PREDICTED: uncharacterized protein LOC108522994 [Rhinopithecus bieti]|uniref:uncharacterized protein LOC108522994 n=1 Tax=Rhinopithecus bieti TaxID=61621 RepID=UPI00083C0400|nr:PREDICTED: uncharacterized protein LOC108522994 [Rhinopithecus bieti]